MLRFLLKQPYVNRFGYNFNKFNPKWSSSSTIPSFIPIIKSFDQIEIGDFILNYSDKDIYRVYGKLIEEEMKVDNIPWVREKLLTEKYDPIKNEILGNKLYKSSKDDCIEYIKRNKTEQFHADIYQMWGEELVMDKETKKYSLLNQSNLKIGDIIMNKRDGKNYKLVSFKQSRSYDYADTVGTDWSFYNIVEVDENLEPVHKDKNENEKLNVGDWPTMFLDKFIVTKFS